jgi:excisionase family DNA binding protein
MDTLLLKPVEVAAELRISRAKAYELIALNVHEGGIPSIKVGSSTRVPVAALQAWIERQLSERAERL